MTEVDLTAQGSWAVKVLLSVSNCAAFVYLFHFVLFLPKTKGQSTLF